MPKENLSEILEKLQSDDQAVLKSLFQEHYLSVCKSIYRFVKDKSTTEDIAQDVFIKFWEKRKQLNIMPGPIILVLRPILPTNDSTVALVPCTNSPRRSVGTGSIADSAARVSLIQPLNPMSKLWPWMAAAAPPKNGAFA